MLQEPTERRWLFALDYPATWPADAQLSVDYELVRDEAVTSVIRYRIASQPDFIDTPRLMEVYRRIALELPEGSNPRTREFARALRAEYADDRALVDAVLNWFRSEPFFYSLEAPPLGRNGADEFLFDLRVGYCEYYASAFAILMRAAGIPTRIVTGYQGGYWQQGADYLLVRQSDAHAWNEVWLDGQGCVPIHWLMEDAATAEIARAQLWQWLHYQQLSGHSLHLDDGSAIDFTLFDRVLLNLPTRLGERTALPGGSRIDEAIALLDELTQRNTLADFLTLPAYPRLT